MPFIYLLHDLCNSYTDLFIDLCYNWAIKLNVIVTTLTWFYLFIFKYIYVYRYKEIFISKLNIFDAAAVSITYVTLQFVIDIDTLLFLMSYELPNVRHNSWVQSAAYYTYSYTPQLFSY